MDADLVPEPAHYSMQAAAPRVGERLPTPGAEWPIRLRHADAATVLAPWVERGSRQIELTRLGPLKTTATISGRASDYRARQRHLLRRGLAASGSPVIFEIRQTATSVEGLRDE